eukprot:CAMPEP_0116034988 /NCGR_PEP_ID=MMETSP0321-20121206/20031_1 /TAXON_ID=163516 /ORGANISM="Leptocylindrus danicus var. danicus, Strain B650" /LENGTH=56 /DNA_ID=CAMNT_0003511597 /DNA_START=1257 /DNA_END=1427 /DNA_ORIENTATION=-
MDPTNGIKILAPAPAMVAIIVKSEVGLSMPYTKASHSSSSSRHPASTRASSSSDVV